MKIIFTLILLLSSLPSYSQLFTFNGWTEQNPYPTTRNLFALTFIDNNTGWAFGLEGIVVRTTNGGLSYTPQHTPDTINCYDAFAISDQKVVACGSTGHIFYTTNGGTLWQQANSNTVRILRSIYFVNSLTGFACGVGGTFVKTTDGGINWDSIPTFFSGHLNDIMFINTNTGFAASETNFLLKTTNGGTFWTSTSVPSSKYAVHFLNANTGFVLGTGGGVKRTTDGGTTWTTYFSGLSQFDGIHFLNSSTGYFTRENGNFILKTTDGGENYKIITSDTKVEKADYVNDSTGFTVGLHGFMAKTHNGGTNWSPISYGTREELYDIYFFNALTGFSCGTGGALVRTTNGGNNWIAVNSGTTTRLAEIYFYDQNTGYISGENGLLIKTTNGGTIWQTLNTGITGSSLSAASFVNANTGLVAVRGSNYFIKTTNAGNNWFQFSTPFKTGCVKYYNDSTIIAGGLIINQFPWEKLFKSTNDGLNWISTYRESSDVLMTIMQIFNDTGYAIRNENTGVNTFKTTNAGNNWFELPYVADENNFEFQKDIPLDPNFTDIMFINPTTGFYLTDYSPLLKRVVKTTNGGIGWQWHIPFPDFEVPQWGIYFVDENTGYICGRYGMILKTTTGGPVMTNLNNENGTEVPEDFTLSQNYPNPFNPSTKIKFEVPHSEMVNLKIYNSLGQEVAELVNSNLSPGRYEYTLDGSALPSGIYFYRLQAGEFFETKKMILVK